MKAVLWVFSVTFVFFIPKESNGQIEPWDDWVPTSELNLFPTLPIAAPFSEDEKCREESRRLILNLMNKTLWAVQMWDSSATSTFGLLYGNKYYFGNYDECLAVTKPIRAHYCQAKIRATVHLKEAFDGDPYEIDPPPNVTVWKKFQDSRRDRTKYARDESQWGLCVPSACNATEMEKAINLHLEKLNKKFLETNGTTYQVEIPENYCHSGEEEEFSYGEIGFWMFTWLLLIVVGIATSIDFAKSTKTFVEKWRATKILMSFSLKRNIPSLMKNEAAESDKLSFLYGIRCTSIILIVVDHHVAIFLASVMFNTQNIEQALRSYQNVFLPQGDLVVDTFFFVGGFLVCHMLLNTLQKKKHINFFFVILHRFLRLAPLYFFIVWFHASALMRFGSGPSWKLGLEDEIEYCRKNWWANVLFIQNYVNPKEMCMIHAWYLPCDMHFFFLTVLIVILIQKNKKIGVGVLSALTAISILIPGIVTYVKEIEPIISFNPKFIDKPRADPSFEYLYVKSHTRAAVYLMGVMTAYYLFEKRSSTWRISTKKSVSLCFVAMGLLFAPMLYGSTYYNPRKTYSLVESVIFSILRRFSWGLAWVVFMTVNRFGVIPIFGKIFSWKISVPLSKTTYGVYLIHFILQMSDEAKVKIPYQFISFDMFVKGTNDLFFATGYALVLYLVVELPFRLLFKELLFPQPKEKFQPKLEPIESNRKSDPDTSQIYSIKL